MTDAEQLFQDPRVRIDRVRIDLRGDASFTRKFGKRVKANVGGRYNECRGSNTTRCVNLKLRTAEDFALVMELLQQEGAHYNNGATTKARARDPHADMVWDTLVLFELECSVVDLDGRGRGRAPVTVRLMLHPGTTAEALISTLRTHVGIAREKVQQEIDKDPTLVFWADDPALAPAQRAREIHRLETQVGELERALAGARETLERLRGEHAAA